MLKVYTMADSSINDQLIKIKSVDSQRGPGKHSCGAPLERKFLIFSFQNGALQCTLYFCATTGPQMSRARGSLLPPTPPSRRDWSKRTVLIHG